MASSSRADSLDVSPAKTLFPMTRWSLIRMAGKMDTLKMISSMPPSQLLIPRQMRKLWRILPVSRVVAPVVVQLATDSNTASVSV